NMEKLHLMAEALIKYETIDRFQIDDIMDGKVPRPPQSWGEAPPSGGAAGLGAKETSKGKGTFGKIAEQY
ncbi:MAG TPA: ATP-dependent metalloprotease, partial [Methylocaldum sp.]|nr:ATP-dependent metalloprotease [Methylocaldum sp.]